MRKSLLTVLLAGIAGLLPGGSWAQALPGDRNPAPGTTFNVRTLDFDLWCQQTQRYATDRCAARRPEDVKAFEDIARRSSGMSSIISDSRIATSKSVHGSIAIRTRLSRASRTACPESQRLTRSSTPSGW